MNTRITIEPSTRRILNIQHIRVGNYTVVGSYMQWLEIYSPHINNVEYLFSLVGNLCIHKKLHSYVMLKERSFYDVV